MRRLVSILATFAVIAGCSREHSPTPDAARTVVVYSSADKEFAELVFAAYEKKTGVHVLPVYDTEETKTAGLTSRLIAEKARPRADVFWSSDTSRAVALAEQGLAEPYAPPTADGITSTYRDSQQRWTGFAARIRVIIYNTRQVAPAAAPRSILDFTRPEWKGRFAIPNPHFGTMSYHVAALFVRWGDTRATDFLEALKSNAAVIAAGNADVKDRVASGQVAAGIVDEDDAIVAMREKQPIAIVIPDQDGADAIGTPVMPNVAMLIRDSPHGDEGRKFIDFLVSTEAERILAGSAAAQFPLHAGVAGPSELPPLDRVKTMDVDYAAVAKKLPSMDTVVRSIFGI
jgi:iron(III) transport system substrate-binding protein